MSKNYEWGEILGCYCYFDMKTGQLIVPKNAQVVRMESETSFCMVVAIKEEKIWIQDGGHAIAEVPKKHVKVL